MKILLWLWQLPQHLLGLILIKALKAKKRFLKLEHGIIEYWLFERDTKFSKFISGVSLGQYILLAPNNNDETTVKHEHGHSIQSKYLGLFYLLVIGIYSAVFCNLWDRVFHKDWLWWERYEWYYLTRWTEKWADIAGGVDRDKTLSKLYRPDDARYPKTH